jgi:hypothetical protein
MHPLLKVDLLIPQGPHNDITAGHQCKAVSNEEQAVFAAFHKMSWRLIGCSAGGLPDSAKMAANP